VAKRAKELKERQARLATSEETGKLILQAIDEIEKGRVKVKLAPPKEE
jgi:DNA-directed RNA polymerase subunit K/omega